MLAYTYIEQGKFELREKPKPELQSEKDAIVKITLASIILNMVAYHVRYPE